MDAVPQAEAPAASGPPIGPVGPGPIGMVGLGMMGRPMAARLLHAGRDLVLFDRDPAALAALAERARAEGGRAPRAVDGLAALAAECRLVALMLPDSAAVSAAMRGADGAPGLLALSAPGTLFVDMGSSLPAETRALAAEARERGMALIDAPVSGGVAGAVAGTLAIMAGGGDDELERAGPLLEPLGRAVIRTGPVGSAHAMKALNNYVYAAGLLAACEALRMAEELGLDPSVFTAVMNSSSGRNVATSTKLEQFVLSGGFDGGFQLGLMRKDLETAGAVAAEVGFDAAALRTCREAWSAALAARGPGVDNTEMYLHLGGKRRQ